MGQVLGPPGSQDSIAATMITRTLTMTGPRAMGPAKAKQSHVLAQPWKLDDNCADIHHQVQHLAGLLT